MANLVNSKQVGNRELDASDMWVHEGSISRNHALEIH